MIQSEVLASGLSFTETPQQNRYDRSSSDPHVYFFPRGRWKTAQPDGRSTRVV